MSDNQKYWTYGEAKAKVREDLDLDEEDPDEQFISNEQMIGFFNEAIDFAEGEVTGIDKDYFLTNDFVPLEDGEDTYDMPVNILGRKFRGIVYSNGALRYQVKKYRRMDKFLKIADDAANATSTDEYKYYLLNSDPNEGTKFVINPPARETSSTVMLRWYLRQANSIPLPGEYTNPETLLASEVTLATSKLAVNPVVPYVTGDKVKLSVSGSSVLPGGIEEDTVYYLIVLTATTVQLAESLVNAQAGTFEVFADVGTGSFTMTVAATDAIIDATVLDIPEFHPFIMEWVKANCLLEDGDPRIAGVVSKLETLKEQIVELLGDDEPDDDNTMEMDTSAYDEMS